MAQSGDSDPGDFHRLRRQGAQPVFDIVAIAATLANLHSGNGLRVLFDWSDVESWPFRAPPPAAIRAWNSRAPVVSRAAIIHNQKWDRHAALLSALIRVRNGQARSFHVPDHGAAI